MNDQSRNNQQEPRRRRPNRDPQGQDNRSHRQDRDSGTRAPAPIRKRRGASNAILAAIILVVLIALAAVCVMVIPKSCSDLGGGNDGNDINVVNTEGSVLSKEQIVDRAKDRYAGTWVISSVTWQGEEGDSSQIPQKVVIDANGSCTISQGEVEYGGKWEIDGDSLYVNAKAEDGSTMTKVLSIDDTNLNISSNNGTGVYVRTSKPSIESAE